MRKCSKQFTRRQSTFFKDDPIKIKMWTNDKNNTERTNQEHKNLFLNIIHVLLTSKTVHN